MILPPPLREQARVFEIVRALVAQASVFPLQRSTASRAFIRLIGRMLAPVKAREIALQHVRARTSRP